MTTISETHVVPKETRYRARPDTQPPPSPQLPIDPLAMARAALRPVSRAVIKGLKPIKIYAYRTRSKPIKRLILELTSPIDLLLVVANIQDETMQLHEEIYGGNFVFGKAVAITSHARTSSEIIQRAMRCNHFMGLDIIAADSRVFATNAPSLNQCPPVREHTRAYLEREILPDAVRHLDYDAVARQCREILGDWKADPEMATMFGIRSTATRLFLKLLADVTVPAEEADAVTREYIRRFGEATLFYRHARFLMGLLGTHEALMRDVYLKLKQRGINLLTIEVTLFAAMFSVGTIVLKAISYAQEFGIDYRALDPEQRRRFVIEALRLYPTVTSVHRMVEQRESVNVAGHTLELEPGDEVIYPFICANRDPARFDAPNDLRLDRPQQELDAILSWSKGPHECPAKDLSIVVTQIMLDTLAERFDLSKLRILNLSF